MVYIDPDMERQMKELEDKSAQEILKWAASKFDGEIVLASSFGAEDVVLIDMIARNCPGVSIFALDTGRLPQATYEVMEKVRHKYNIGIQVYFPDTKEVEEMVTKHGPDLFYQSKELRKLCCDVRKMEPFGRALDKASAWISGLRKDQSVTRTGIAKVEIDEAHGNIIKVNPLTEWTNDEVWGYIRENDVPYNKLHDSGFPSIGCAPCTRAVEPGEDIRAGRWWWEDPEQKECGLHVKSD